MPAAAIDRDASVALVAAWLDAQNRGDFEAYRAMYAPAFRGIKRTTRRERRFDREGWLEDRERMFRRPMEVSATSIDVLLRPDGANVRFVQRWSSGRYADEGEKRMHLVRVDGRPKIAFEELLAPVPLSESEVALDSGVMLVTYLTDGRAYAVVGRAPSTMRGGRTRLIGPARDTRQFAARDVERSDAEASAVLLDEPLSMVTPSRACTARVRKLLLVRGVETMDGSAVSEEDDTDGDTNPIPTPDPDLVWEASAFGAGYSMGDSGTPWLLAELDTACDGNARLAVRPGAPMPRFVPGAELSRLEARPYVERFARTQGGREIEGNRTDARTLVSILEHPMDEASFDSNYLAIGATRFGPETNSSTVLQLSFGGDCGGSSMSVLMVGSSSSARTIVDGYPDAFSVIEAFDLEGDGIPEVIASSEDGGELWLLRLGPHPGILRRFGITMEVCGC